MDKLERIQKTVCIIGAGISGLSAGYFLKKLSQFQIKVFEKNQTLGGRIQTNSQNGFTYDYGANYFSFYDLKKGERAFFKKLIYNELPPQQVIEIAKPLYLFTKNNMILPVAQVGSTQQKLNYKSGLITLPNYLNNKLDITYNTKVSKIIRNAEQNIWDIYEKENIICQSKFVIMTPPAPVASNIFQNSIFGEHCKIIRLKLIEELNKCPFNSLISVAIAIDAKIEKKFFSLLNVDRWHDIVWISFENDKQNRVPEGKTLMIVQMGTKFSKENFDLQDDKIFNLVLDKSFDLLSIDHKLKAKVMFHQVYKFEQALPMGRVDGNSLQQGNEIGLFFAGDYLRGRARVLLGLETGMQAAEKISLAKPKI